MRSAPRAKEPARDLVREISSSAQYFFSVADIALRLHLSEKRVRELIRPYRGRCHLARRGRHPRLLLWVPKEVVVLLVRERDWPAESPVASNAVKAQST